MPKTRAQKEEILSKTVDRLGKASSVVLVNIQGVKVGEIEAIRDGLFAQGLHLQIAKNSLLKRALEEVKIEVPTELMDQPLGLIMSYEDPVAAAKLTNQFKADIETLEVVGGIYNQAFMSVSEVDALAKLPSREQLLGQLVGTLSVPLSGMLNVLQGNIRGLVTVLSQISEGKTA